jgi:oxygen-independent coproporphyrinogen-3 oxidase
MKKNFAAELKTVYIGGGTPTILPESCLAQIFSQIRKSYIMAPAPEITVEANPGTLTADKAVTLQSLGINRVSLGVQSFLDSELRTLGRVHTAADAAKAAEMLQAAGIGNLSLDLIYGIPGQTIGTWKDTLYRATGLLPKHISAYELTPEKGTPFEKSLAAGELSMPDEECILDQFHLAIDCLAEKGFRHYEISNYALPGYHCVHNLNYWDRGEYLAAGAGAHSFIKGRRSRNTGRIREYIETLARGMLPEAESTEIPCEAALSEFVFLGLRKIEGIRLELADELGLNLAEAASALTREGLLELADNHLRLTRKGLPVANSVIVTLLRNLKL